MLDSLCSPVLPPRAQGRRDLPRPQFFSGWGIRTSKERCFNPMAPYPFMPTNFRA
jgi:hypothetical protein